MTLELLFPLLLLACSLLAAGAGWLAGRSRPAAAGTLVLLVIAGVLGSVQESPGIDAGPTTLLVALGGLLALAGGGPVTTAVFQLVDGSAAAEAASVRSAGEVLRGGAWIGVLERAAVFATLLVGWPEGLVVALGLKGLGRYPELRNQDHTGTAERFIIGTFTSVLWAAACAGVTHVVLS